VVSGSATAQQRNSGGRIIFAADAVPGAIKSSSHAVASFTDLADAASRTVGSASRTADGFNQTAGSINRTAPAANHTAGSFDHAAGRIIRPAAASSRANQSFIRTGKSSSRAVICQKQAKTAKNRPFCPFRRANCSQSASLPTGPGRARHSVRAADARTLANDGSLATLTAGRGLPALPDINQN
jgi:hypothetical protein